jgi:hypothetical protein
MHALRYGIRVVWVPLLGGVLTSKATWCWCFYINLPVGAVMAILLLLFFHPAKANRGQKSNFVRRILKLDVIGNFILIVTVVMLLLVL